MNRHRQKLFLLVAATLPLVVCATSGLSRESDVTVASPQARSTDVNKLAIAADTKPAKIVSIAVFPQKIELENPYAYRQLLVTAETADGRSLDITRDVTVTGGSSVLHVSPHGLVRPIADGSGELVVSTARLEARVSFRVTGLDEPFEADFVRDVNPILSRLGCNAGICHGAASGKNGFKLSLRGYNPEFDHRALIDDLAGRRFNRAAPDQSLMLLKPAGGAPHVGGVLMHPGEPYYEIIRNWIAGGAELNLSQPPVVGISLHPEKPRMELTGEQLQAAVIATFADGTTRDVTQEAFIESSQTEIVTIKDGGLATAERRGEAAILARYEGAYASQHVIVMGDRTRFQWLDTPEFNHIDTLVYRKLRDVKIQPTGLCSDEEFIRRVYLDLTGMTPQPEQVRAFVSDATQQRIKRSKLVDRLISSPEYVEYWTNKWADLLQVNRKFLGKSGAWAFRDWICQAIATNMPYDKFAYEVLTASGSTLENPPASYYKTLRTPEDLVENTTQLFLATRFNCNKCHDHPFERWTQDQYYELAAYFSQVDRKDHPQFADQQINESAIDGAKAAVEIIYDSGTGEVQHIRTGEIAQPRFPYEHDGEIPQTASRREKLAHWIATKENPYFAKSYVNRLWSYLLGRGLIDPIDDIRAGNPPSNPELLDYLTEEFVKSGFDAQHTLRTICNSRVYQHSIQSNEWNVDDAVNFSHAIPRRLSAEALFDAIHVATGADPKLPGMPKQFRAVELPDSDVSLPDGFLQLFGKPPRESACECERSNDVMLGPVLNLINGPTVAEAVSNPDNRLARLVAEISDDRQLISEVYLSILCRAPTNQEVQLGLMALSGYELEGKLLRQDLSLYESEQLSQRFETWLAEAKPGPLWDVLMPIFATAESDATLTVNEDGTILVSGASAERDAYVLEFAANITAAKALRVEALTDNSLPAKGPGRAPNGNFVLSDFDLEIATGERDFRPHRLNNASATFEQPGFKALNALGGFDAKRGWAISPQLGKPQTAVFQARSDFGDANGPTRLRVTIRQAYGGAHVLGKFRISISESERPVKVGDVTWPADVSAILAKPEEDRTAEELARLQDYYRTQDQGLLARQRQLADHAAASDNARLRGVQDLAWALINSPAFLFNR
ncbi:MAG: DUF1549 and DUF1553 domain-containing protein [Pirellulales bacterium]|nr:DUF1549 and DUF1553 domain-containing protein [Pirellulales bacterium]